MKHCIAFCQHNRKVSGILTTEIWKLNNSSPNLHELLLETRSTPSWLASHKAELTRPWSIRYEKVKYEIKKEKRQGLVHALHAPFSKVMALHP
jgi:hypothetical protein